MAKFKVGDKVKVKDKKVFYLDKEWNLDLCEGFKGEIGKIIALNSATPNRTLGLQLSIGGYEVFYLNSEVMHVK